MKLTVRAMCLYEELTGKSFLAPKEEDDYVVLMYAIFISSNDVRMTLEAFTILISSDEKTLRWMMDEFEQQMKFDDQFSKALKKATNVSDETVDETVNSDEPVPFVATLAGYLVSHGMDPHYVMYEMSLWEMYTYREGYEDIEKNRLAEERMWTYISILPHLDKKSTSKLKSPQDLLKFPWEEEASKIKAKQLDKITEAAVAFLSKAKKDG